MQFSITDRVSSFINFGRTVILFGFFFLQYNHFQSSPPMLGWYNEQEKFELCVYLC
jgi:hypothetical protein